MSGILDSKTRIFDTYITDEGRRQLAEGKFNAKFYSFSDGYSIYDLSTIASASSNVPVLDETYRLCLEASSSPYDQVTFEADDSGRLFNVKGFDLNTLAGQIFSGSAGNIITGSQFASTAGSLLSSSLGSYQNLRILSSPDFFDQNFNDFIISKPQSKFIITNDKPILSRDIQKISINEVESLFMDKRLSHIPNFRFLPPVNKALMGEEQTSLGDYQSLNQAPIQTYEDLKEELSYYEQNGYVETIEFLETTRQNNLFSQFFEVSENTIIKLDVIEFGQFTTTEENHETKNIFFVGKVFIDNNDQATFVNMFTLVFD